MRNMKSPPAIVSEKGTKPIPGCAGNIGTGYDSGWPLAKLPLAMFEFMVCKGTADGGGTTCILLTLMKQVQKLAMAKGLHCQIEV